MIQVTHLIRSPRRAAVIALSSAFVAACLSVGAAKAEDTVARAPAPAAIDWEILARLRQTVQVDTNRRLAQNQDDLAARSVSGVTIEVNGQTKRTQFSIATGLEGGFSTDSSDDSLNRIDPNVLASAIYSGKRVALRSSAQFRARPTSTSEIDDSGVTGVDATRFDVNVSAGASWQATARDTLSLTTTADVVDFSRSIGSLTPSRTFGVSTGWSRQATQTTQYSFSAGFRHFDSDGANGRKSNIFNLSAGLEHRRTSRHTIGAEAGVSLVSSDLTSGGSDTNAGFIGGLTFDYVLNQLQAGLDLNQSVQPSSDGDLNAFTRLTGDVRYRVNAIQSLGFVVTYFRRSDVSGGGDVLQVFNVGPNYSHRLGKDTLLTLGYQFRVRDDINNDFETGHRVLLTLAHDLTLLP